MGRSAVWGECALVAALGVVLAGCYNPTIGDGAQRCSSDGRCPSGMSCFPDDHCYKTGEDVGCKPACVGATPVCDQATLTCVGCLMDSQCAGATPVCDTSTSTCVACLMDGQCGTGQLCVNKACASGCSPSHSSCIPDGGSCDVDLGICRGCRSDAECGPAAPRCDLPNGRCVPCLPASDNCPLGSYCVPGMGTWSCLTGCKTTADCPRPTPRGMPDAGAGASDAGPASDGGDVDASGLDASSFDAADIDAAGVDASRLDGSGSDGGEVLGALTCCNHVCVDTTADSSNCGACGTACSANAATCCSSICINLVADTNHCGACGTVCNAANGVSGCAQSACTVASCIAPYLDCDGNAMNGCEVDSDTDVANCGGCSVVCATPPNVATPSCAGGQCGIGQCASGFADCDGQVPDGCEIDTDTDVTHCGGCNVVCGALPQAQVGCVGGACVIASCNGAFIDCDKLPADGCEVNPLTDVNNCGACGNVCKAVPNASTACKAGGCGLGTCNLNFANCDGSAANGCEIDTANDPKNCGGCAKPCVAGDVCVNSACVLPVGVVLVAASGYASDVQTQIKNTGAFTTVDLFNAQTATPTVAQLQVYAAALVFSDSTFVDPVTLGNNLATYWNGGGRVVVATFADTTISVTGTWGTPANGYIFITPAAQAEPSDSLGAINEPASPLMAGVTTWAATAAYRSTGAVINNGVVVAAFKSGTPMIVRGVLSGRNIVELNFYPPSSAIRADFWTGDGATILKNALLFK